VTQTNDLQELANLASSMRRHLQRRQRVGIHSIPAAPAFEPAVASEEADLFSDNRTAYQAKTLDELRTAIADCRRCKLWPGRTHLVFGVGNPNAKLMFIGEGPGRDEDLQGEPFVGRAGQLLTDIITKGMGLRREDVYIANVVKCRPPDNRNPEPDEVASCEPFLKRQIDLVRPEIIVALGKFAVQTLLQSKVPITRLRGNWHTYHGIKLMPTFHPAYLLRNPGDKKLVWEDIKKVIQEMRGGNA
jgi:uracil-DNA glycosylase family 4